MASTRRPTASTQPRVVPLDAAEQDQVLRSRLSHTLSHRPLQGLKSKISLLASASPTSDALSPAYTLQRASLLSDLQSYLLSLSRTSLITSSTASTQVQEYERQYEEIKAEEARSIQRIAGLKKQLAEVRRRRREKLEYGRVAESLEAWFKNGGGVGSGLEIEESLSNLLSHLTSSFLYNPSSTATSEEASSSAAASTSSTTSPHAHNLSLLHAKIDEMLNLSRQVREIVGWKAGSGSATGGSNNAAAGGGPAGAGQGQGQERSRATSPGSRSTTALPSAGLLNPHARPFEPGSGSASSISTKRSRVSGRPDDLYVSISSSSGLNSGGLGSSDLEEGEEPVPSSSSGMVKSSGGAEGSKRRRVDASRGAGAAGGAGGGGREEGEADDDDEEGSIPPATASGSTASAAAAPAAAGAGASTPSAAAATSASASVGRGAQPLTGRRGLPARVVANSAAAGSGNGNTSGARGRGRASRGR